MGKEKIGKGGCQATWTPCVATGVSWVLRARRSRECPQESPRKRGVLSSTKRLHTQTIVSRIISCPGYKYNYIDIFLEEKSFLHAQLFPMVQKHFFNCMKKLLRELFCCQDCNYNHMIYSSSNYLRNNFVDHGLRGSVHARGVRKGSLRVSPECRRRCPGESGDTLGDTC